MQRQSSSEHLEWHEGNLESGLARGWSEYLKKQKQMSQKIRVLRRKHTDGLLNMRLRTGKMAMRLCLPARFMDESEALSFPLPLLMRLS